MGKYVCVNGWRYGKEYDKEDTSYSCLIRVH